MLLTLGLTESRPPRANKPGLLQQPVRAAAGRWELGSSAEAGDGDNGAKADFRLEAPERQLGPIVLKEILNMIGPVPTAVSLIGDGGPTCCRRRAVVGCGAAMTYDGRQVRQALEVGRHRARPLTFVPGALSSCRASRRRVRCPSPDTSPRWRRGPRRSPAPARRPIRSRRCCGSVALSVTVEVEDPGRDADRHEGRHADVAERLVGQPRRLHVIVRG